MGFGTAFTTDQYDLVRGQQYASDWLFWLCTNRVVFSGTIADTLSSDPTWLQFDYASTISGSYTDVEPFQAILINQTNDIMKASYRGRIREEGADATTVYVNESGAGFDPGAYFWVIDTYDITYRAWRPSTLDPLTAVVLVDGNITYRPMQPAIIGLRTAYVGVVDPITTKMRIAFDISASYAAEVGATITDFLFTFRSSTYTVVSGSLDSDTVTVDFDDNVEQWGKVEVTDSNGTVAVRRFYISTLPPNTGFEDSKVTVSNTLQQGWTMRTTAFDGVDDLLNNTFIAVARVNEQSNYVSGTLDENNNIVFVGWMQRETDDLKADPTAGVTSPSQFEFTGVAARISRLMNQTFAFKESATPTLWGDITTLTTWRAVKDFLDYFSTVTVLCELSFDSTDDAYNFPEITTQGGNLGDAINGMVAQINALFEYAPDGRMGAFREFTYLTASERLALTTVAQWDARDAVGDGITKTQEENPNIGKLDGSGAVYNTSNQQVVAFAVRAPALAQGEAQGTETLNAQILAATSDTPTALAQLEQRAGDKFVYVNNSLFLEQTTTGAYYLINSSHSEFYTWSLDGDTPGPNGINRINYTTDEFWVVESVTYTRNGNGSATTKVRYHYAQPTGQKGVDVTPVPQNSVDNPLPDLGLPAFNFELPELMFPDSGLAKVNPKQLAPPKGQLAKTDGSTLLVWGNTKLLLVTNFIALTVPTQRDITPSGLGSFQIKYAIFDPLNKAKTGGNNRAYCLVSDGTDSKVYSTTNVFSPTPTWTVSNTFSGVYNILRETGTPGSIELYSPGLDSITTYTDSFTGGLGAKTKLGSQVVPPLPSGVALTHGNYSATGGRGGGGCYSGTSGSGGGFDAVVACVVDLGAEYTVTAASFWAAMATTNLSSIYIALFDGSGVSVHDYISANFSCSPTYQQFSGSGAIAGVRYIYFGAQRGAAVETYYFDDLSVTYGTPNDANIRISTDYAATFGSPVTVGDTPGDIGGLATQKAGTVQYASADNQVKIATTLGGAFSNANGGTLSAEPVSLLQPYFVWGSLTTRNTTGSTPDYAVLTNASGSSLKRITGAGTVTDITPVAGFTGSIANAITSLYGKYMAVTGLVSDVPNVYATKDCSVASPAWTLVRTGTDVKFIRTRRGNTQPTTNGGGQLYVADGIDVYYSSTWIGTLYPRTIGFTVMGFDPLG